MSGILIRILLPPASQKKFQLENLKHRMQIVNEIENTDTSFFGMFQLCKLEKQTHCDSDWGFYRGNSEMTKFQIFQIFQIF